MDNIEGYFSKLIFGLYKNKGMDKYNVLILLRKCPISIFSKLTSNNETLLMISCRFRRHYFIDYICNNNYLKYCNIKQKNKNNDSIIHIASQYNNYNMIKKIIESNIDYDLCDSNCDGDTPLILACKYANKKIAKLLLNSNKKCNVDHVNLMNSNALMWALSNKMEDIAFQLISKIDLNNLKHVNNHSQTTLVYAFAYNNNNFTKFLLDNYFDYCDVNKKLINGTAFEYACKDNWNIAHYMFDNYADKIFINNDIIQTCIFNTSCEIANKIIMKFYNTNGKFSETTIRLFKSNMLRILNIINSNNKLIVSLYNDLNIKNFIQNYDYSNLLFRIAIIKNNVFLVDEFIKIINTSNCFFLNKIKKFDCSRNLKNYYLTYLKNNIPCRLICHAVNSKNDIICNQLLKYPELCDVRYYCKHNILFKAILNLKEETCLDLFSKVNDIDKKSINKNNDTILTYAIINNMEKLSVKAIEYCDIYKINNHGNTALILAIKNNMKAVYNKIIDMNYLDNVYHVNKQNKSALGLLIKNKNKKILNIIYEKLSKY